jgi:hypothetical protein
VNISKFANQERFNVRVSEIAAKHIHFLSEMWTNNARKRKGDGISPSPFEIPLFAVDYDFAAEQTVSMINCVVTYGSQFAFGRRSSM